MKRILGCLVLFLLATTAAARVISYAPYTDRSSVVSFQSRTARHFLLTELTNPLSGNASQSDVVLYDSASIEEPRVVLQATRVHWAAMWEDERNAPAILVATAGRFQFSSDRGVTWKETGLPASTWISVGQNYVDNGGPFTRGRFGPVLIGNRDHPFVVLDSAGAVWRVDANGIATKWTEALKNSMTALMGRDASGKRFLVRRSASTFALVGDGLDRTLQLPTASADTHYSGWITAGNEMYLESSRLGSVNAYPNSVLPEHSLWHVASNGHTTQIQLLTSESFAVPTADYAGAWVMERSHAATNLSRHTAAGREFMWLDEARPAVEALIPGASGNTVLIQVNRPRPQPDRIIKDPALAVWHVGQPKPSHYDELFLAEETNKGFVHVDPDALEGGESFVFDSGFFMPMPPPQVIISPFTPGAGADILQEWGVVRASLLQRLVLPGVGRTLGAYGSNWTTDVTLHNPAGIPQKVELHFVQSGAAPSPSVVSADRHFVTLNAKEIRVIPDILGTLFGRVGNGALFLTPEIGINAISRTYTRVGSGSFGFGMNAIDVFAAASPRFPVSFAGAFPGTTFRTNVTLTDTTGKGSETQVLAAGPAGLMGAQNVAFGVPAAGQQQFNEVQTTLGVTTRDGGGLVVRPKRGFVVASVFAIDNLTNDPTYFPPDISGAVPRWIPVIGHVDGAHGAQFRTDLHLYNPGDNYRTLYLTAYPWDIRESADTASISLRPNEARVIRDVYFTLFRKTGLGRLRYQTWDRTSGVRVTSRTYNLNANGGTYGALTPPFNGFQMAARGESLEILGATGDARFRTNLGIVDMNMWPAPNQDPASTRVEIIDERGETIDDFVVTVPIASGTQVNDIFRTRGYTTPPAAALIRISPIRGQIAAYATVTDNETNDSIFLAPYLAAQQ